MKKQYDKAFDIWKKDYARDPQAVYMLESGFEAGGYEASLKKLAELLIERSNEKFVTPWRISTLYARAGMAEASLVYLRKAYDVHDQNMPYIISDPIFDYMRNDPGFQQIVKMMNFPGG